MIKSKTKIKLLLEYSLHYLKQLQLLCKLMQMFNEIAKL